MADTQARQQSPKWLAQERVLVRFKDDPTLLHERVVLDCHSGNLVKVSTPDRDINETVLEVGNIYSDVIRKELSKLPGRIRERDTYLAKHSGYGEFSADEIRQLAEEALKTPYEVPLSHRVTGKTPRACLCGVEAEETAAEGFDGRADGRIWMAVYRSSGKALGDEVSVPGDAKQMTIGSKKYAMFALTDVEKLAPLFRLGASVEDQRDIRVLPVLFDEAEERWRTLAEALPSYEEVEFDDFPLQGPRTLYRDARQLRRQGMDFQQHHESWLKKSGVRSTDRSVYEHSTLCRVLQLMASYDQLNLAALASAEALNRRRALIEVAHQGRPDTPSYEGSEEIMGVRESADGSIIDPALTAHAAKRQAAKAEIQKQKRLAAEEKRLGTRVDREEDGDKGAGRGRGRGKKAPEDP